MNSFFNLLKFNISYYLKPRFKEKKDRNKFIGLSILLIVCVLFPVAMMLVTLYVSSGLALKANIFPEFLSLIFFTAQLGVLFLGLSTYMSVIYFSNDNELLASLPLKSTHIYLSKLVVCLISMVLISSIIVIPTMIAAGLALVKSGVKLTLSYYLMGLVGIFTIPLIPLLFISIISFPMMKLISYLKKRPTLMAVITAILTSGIFLAVYIPLIKFETNFTGEDMILSESMINLIKNMGTIAYPTLLLSRSMLGISLLKNVSLFLLITIAALAIAIILSLFLYKNTISKMSEGGITRNKEKKNVKATQLSVNKSLFMREVKFVCRESQIFLQTLMMLILCPVMCFIVFFVMPMGYEGIETQEDVLQGIFIKTTMMFFMTSFTLSMNYLSIIGISREGNKFALLKTLPLSCKDILKVKLFFADIVTVLGVLMNTIIYSFIDKEMVWYFPICVFISMTIMLTSLNSYALLRDVKKPNLTWINAKDVLKNNFGSLVIMLLAVVGTIAMFGLTVGCVALLSVINIKYVRIIYFSSIILISIVYYFIFRYKKLDKMVEFFDMIEA